MEYFNTLKINKQSNHKSVDQPKKHNKNQYRYPGAKPFSTEQNHIFFGREVDIENLYQLISVEQMVLLYSKSGLGKSSLLNAGIIPKIKEEGKYQPIAIRFGANTEDKIDTPSQISCDLVGQKQKIHPLLKTFSNNKNTLWYQLKNRWLNSKKDKGYLLIFDQFEELFTYPESAIHEFKLQLVQALNSDVPQNIRAYIEEQFQEDPNFLSDEDMEQLYTPIKIKIVFAIRSDRMSLVAQLADYIPNILTNCFELDALTKEQAEDAILNPAYLKSANFMTPPFDYSDETIEEILDFLTREHTDKIESFQLAILCQAVEQKVITKKINLVKRNHLGDIESIYKNYYNNQLESIGEPDETYAARILIEDGLIFEEEERRLSMYEGQIHKVYNITPVLLRKLVDSHLLRAEPSMKGGYTYELSHDTLVAPVLRSKRKRKAREALIAQEEARKERETELEVLRQEARQERRRKNQAIMAATAGFVLLFFSVFFYWKAQQQKNIAQEKEAEAKRNLELFEAAQIEKDKKQYDGLIEKGGRLIVERDYVAASEVFETAKDFVEDNSKADSLKNFCDQKILQKNDFEKLISEGDSLYNIGKRKYVKALGKYQLAAVLNYDPTLAKNKIDNIKQRLPNVFEIFRNSGEKFFEAQGYVYALASYRYASEIKPEDPEIMEKIDQCISLITPKKGK